MLSSIINGQIILQQPNFESFKNRYPTKSIASVLLDIDQDFFLNAKSIGSDEYELSIQCKEAGSLNIYFKDIFIPKGAVLTITSLKSGKSIYYDSRSLNPQLATIPLEGEELIIRYEGVKDGANIYLKELGCFPVKAKTSRSSAYCQVDINCSEGEEWQNQKKGVVRLLLKSGAFTVYCSGSLVNNTARDCKPYLFSSEHCLDDVDGVGLAQTIIYFNYESSVCDSKDGSALQTVQGLKLLAAAPAESNSDFALFEIQENLPLKYSPFFNGWDISGLVTSDGVTIHHPSGDVKKISTFSTLIQTADISALPDDFYWEVVWSATLNGHGVTEEGSSGSPLFNDEKLVIGNLTGGTSFCATPFQPDYFGKFSEGWNHELDSNKRLDVWLDPIGTGETSLSGSYFPCSDSSFQYLPTDSIAVLGNPVNKEVNIYIEQKLSSGINLCIYSLNGSLVFKNSFGKNNIANIKIPVTAFRDGVYLVRINAGSNEYIEKIAIIN